MALPCAAMIRRSPSMNARSLTLAASVLLLVSASRVCAQGTTPQPRATPPASWPFSSRATPSPRTANQPVPVASTPAQIVALATERGKLLEGVKSIPRLGAPGPVVAYGALSFPLIITADARAAEAVAAAGSMGKGRAVIFGHTGYLDAGGDGDLDRLLLNAVRWCGGKEKPRVGLKGAKTAALLEKNGIRHESIAALEKKALTGFDVIIAPAQGFTDPAEAAALQSFIEGGGGYIGAVTGWAFGQTSGGKDFATAHLGNQALAGAGLAWTDDSLGAGALEAPVTVSPLLNAFTAIAALTAKPGGAPPAPAAVEQGSKTIQLALSSMPPSSRPAFEKLLGGIVNGTAKQAVPTPEKPLSATSDADERSRASLEARLSRFIAPAEIKLHPAAEKFPGRVNTQARPVSKTVSIDPRVPGWQSTGLYADAGAKIEVKLAPELASRGYAVRIGCHSDQLYKLDQWKRMPEITTVTPLGAPATLAANAFGGLIYIVVPDKAKESAPFSVVIAGGVEAPLFVLGQTTDAQWQQMRQLPAPWAELACKGVILSVPAAVAREVRNPTALMQYWQRVVEAQDELSHVADQRKRPERIVPDVQISAGFMHSGYPIMINLPQAAEMVTYDGRNAPGWGFYHELGHNHQKPEWTFDGTTEVTCNLFSLYIFEAVLGRDKTTGHPAVLPQTQEENWEKHRKAGAPYAAWKADPFLALTCYIQLLDAFGFETLKQVIRSYQGSEHGPLPKTDDQKRDQWMVRYAKIAGKNLGPFFDAWGIPVSAAAKAEIAQLPAWMPKGMK